MKEFLTDVQSVQSRVRSEIGRGPIREGRELGRAVYLLNEALALNMVCVLRHMRHFVTADRFDARIVAQEFLEHTVRESEHSDLIVARIQGLGGAPTFERDSIVSRGHLECESAREFEDIIREDLDAEQLAIETYREMITWFADVDPTSSGLLEQMLSLEEEHAEVMWNFVTVVLD
jgi:bacterioferritin